MSVRVDWNLRLQEIKRLPLGTRRILGKTYPRGKYRYVKMYCVECETVQETSVDSLLGGKSKSCKCQRGVKYHHLRERILADRYYAIQQRCENPDAQSWAAYGGRGIRNRFKSAQQFVEYVLKACPHRTYRNVQIDRIDNNGHYEPGNLRLVPFRQNQLNKRTNVLVRYKGKVVPAIVAAELLKAEHPTCTLDVLKVAMYLRQGVVWTELIHRKGRGPYKKKRTTS